MFCTKCGQELAVEVKFCPQCGLPVGAGKEPAQQQQLGNTADYSVPPSVSPSKPKNGLAPAALVLSMTGTVFFLLACITDIFGNGEDIGFLPLIVILSILAIIFGACGRNKKYIIRKKMATVGLSLGITLLILSPIVMIFINPFISFNEYEVGRNPLENTTWEYSEDVSLFGVGIKNTRTIEFGLTKYTISSGSNIGFEGISGNFTDAETGTYIIEDETVTFVPDSGSSTALNSDDQVLQDLGEIFTNLFSDKPETDDTEQNTIQEPKKYIGVLIGQKLTIGGKEYSRKRNR
jgi:hypothetical protein